MSDDLCDSGVPAATACAGPSTCAAGGSCARTAGCQDTGAAIPSREEVRGTSNGAARANSQVDEQEPKHRKVVDRPSPRAAIHHSRAASEGHLELARSAVSDTGLPHTSSIVFGADCADQALMTSPATGPPSFEQGHGADEQRLLQHVGLRLAAQKPEGDAVPLAAESSITRSCPAAELHNALLAADSPGTVQLERSGCASDGSHFPVLANGLHAASDTAASAPAASFDGRDGASVLFDGEQFSVGEGVALAALDEGEAVGSPTRAAVSLQTGSVGLRLASLQEVRMQELRQPLGSR